jgi:hypothetical protein
MTLKAAVDVPLQPLVAPMSPLTMQEWSSRTVRLPM